MDADSTNYSCSSSDWEPEPILADEVEGLDEEHEAGKFEIPKTEHESPDLHDDIRSNPLPFEYAPEDIKFTQLGQIINFVGPFATVQQGYGDGNALDSESIIFESHSRKALGRVVETFGPVKQPLYLVTRQVEPFPALGTPVSYSLQHARVVKADELKLLFPGCDASNLYDEEVPPDEQECSDDEKELLQKARKKRPGQQLIPDEANRCSYSGASLVPPSNAYLDSTLGDYCLLKRPGMPS